MRYSSAMNEAFKVKNFSAARQKIMPIGQWASVVCLFFIPINKPATNICMALVLAATLFAPNLGQRMRIAISHPVALGTLLWWFILALSALHAPQSTALWKAWLGSITFAYPLLIISLIGKNDVWRKRAWCAFGLSMGLILFVSWCQFFGLLPQLHLSESIGSMRNVVFKDYTQQGLGTLCLASLLFALIVYKPQAAQNKILWLGLAVCFASVFFALDSRTAVFCAALLILLWCALVIGKGAWGKKLSLFLLLSTTISISFALWATNDHKSRMTTLNQEITNHTQKQIVSSAGIRMELWGKSWVLIQKAPVLGHGFDQWHPQFMKLTQNIENYEPYKMRFPHQEFLLIMAEQGQLGFAAFLTLLTLLALYIRNLDMPYRHFYTAFLLLYIAAGMVNSLLADFSHRHLLLVWLGFMPWAYRRLDNKPVTG